MLHRIAGTSPSERMLTIGSNVRDTVAEQLMADLYNPYSDWRADQTPDPGEPHEDPGGDGADNEFERITRTDPNSAGDRWNHGFSYTNGNIEIPYATPPGLFMRFEDSTNLVEWESSILPDYPSNGPDPQLLIPGPWSSSNFFRALMCEP